MYMEITPAKNVLILRDIEIDNSDGFQIPNYEDGRAKPEKGLVIAVGNGESPFGKVKIKKGDIVFYEKYLNNRIDHKGNTYNFVRFDKVMGLSKGDK